jgi:hypothetical protein
MTEQPVDPRAGDSRDAGGDGRDAGRPDVDDLNVTPDVPGPSGTGEQTRRGGDPDASAVRNDEGETG